MNEFIRRPENNNLFEGTSDEVIEVVLKVKDDFNDRYNRNPEIKLRAEQLREILLNENRVCYFQKQKADDKNNRSRHKIIIPFGNERAIETIVGLSVSKIDTFTELYSYYIYKIKEVSFFNEPTKNTTQRNCIFRFADVDQKDGTSANNFKELYKTVESSEIPLVDINKDKDRQIWQNYVDALKKLVNQKEQIWKIQNVEKPYTENKTGETERANFIEIYINEKELIKKLEKNILVLFNEKELEDYGVSESKAFIEFKSYRELGQEELHQFKELGDELFYELSSNSPFHTISGKIEFKYSDNVSKEDIYSEIQEKLQSEYGLEASISNNGYIDLSENDIPHLVKIVSDHYSHILSIYKNNVVHLNVGFTTGNELQKVKQIIKDKLNSEGFDKAIVSLAQDNKYLLVEVSAFVPRNKFDSEGLSFVESVSRFQSTKPIKTKPIDGIELVGNTYQIKNASKDQVDNALAMLQQNFSGVSFRRLRTQYFFKSNEKVNPETLRNFKTQTDLQGKTEFIIANSKLKISAESKTDFDNQLKRIKDLFLTANIEKKEFNPTYQILFSTDIESKRQSIVNKIQNEIRKEVGKSVDFDAVKNHTRLLFEYQFKSEDEREKFKQAVSYACSDFLQMLNFSFENPLGRTSYELFKNETLELEKEKKTASNIRGASFVFISKEQKEMLDKEVDAFNEDYGYLKGFKKEKQDVLRNIEYSQQIGKLLRKQKNKLTFLLSEQFDDLINAKESERVELSEIKQGFIKPIFTGELANIGRMIRAMRKVTDPNLRNGFPINQNLPNFLFDPNEARQSSTDLEEEKQKVLQNLNEPFLKNQPKQLEAVAKTLLAKDLALIQGPPGTGKTTVIAEIIWQTLLREPKAKLLITSQTNLAVDNALERIKGKKLVRPIRLGNMDKFEDEGKVYSNERIKNWIQAKTGSKEEGQNSDNAVCQWIENVKEKCSKEEKYAKAVSKWLNGLNEKDSLIKSSFSTAYYEYVNVFAATCSECGSRNFSDTYQMTFNQNSERKIEPEFDLVIMDEASKATPPELVLPLTLGKKVVIIGDHKQLPPMIDEREFGEALEVVGAKKLIEDWTKDDYKVSQFEKLFKNAPKNFVASLDTQFRMHDQIMNCISEFYSDQEELENGLICGIQGEMNIPDFNVKASRWHGLNIPPLITPDVHAIWVNVDEPEIEEGGHYYSNDAEIEAIHSILTLLIKAETFKTYQDFFKTQSEENQEIGIITFYGPQMKKIGQKLYPSLKPNDWREFDLHKFKNEFKIPFRINTVDKFQGMEKNIVIISTVRSDKKIKIDPQGNKKLEPNRSLGFAKELTRINVGFSRAKRLLIVVGNEKHFSHKQEYQQAIQKMHRIDIAQIQNLIKK
jgi:superfamily I DNA and/or RNA helicase